MTLRNQDIQLILKDYINFIEDEQITGESAETLLSRHLDLIALCSHFVNYTFDEIEYDEPPKNDYKKFYGMIKRKFPEFGHYNTVKDVTENINKTELVIGDSIDDLTDITLEIKDILWKWDNTSIDDALWTFENNFVYHWSSHLRWLQVYMSAQKIGE